MAARTEFEDVRVRDRRRSSWFSIDNEILDVYGPRIGLHGFAVYCALARHSHAGDEEAHVSLRRLCKHLKIGKTKLLQTLDELEDAGLIAIERGDRKTTSTYTMLEVPKGGPVEDQGGPDEDHGGPNEDQGGGPEEDHYKTIGDKN